MREPEQIADSMRHVLEILDDSLAGRPLTEGDILGILARGAEHLSEVCAVADELRQQQAGDRVGYVVNRNINFTNVCVKNCKFCAFSRDLRSEEGYFLPLAEILARVEQAVDFGATEVCVQAGLAPSVDGRIYIDICRAIAERFPEIHIHAFSPEEVLYGSRRSGIAIRDYLSELKDVGLGSLPGTSAEILTPALRDEISPGRIRTDQWTEIIETAHELGIPTTSTMMFGHLETSADIVRHFGALRALQNRTGGFTEFVPLAFVHEESPMYAQSLVEGLRAGPTETESRLVYATARIALGDVIPNLQASWVKHGLPFATELLGCGANDLGGTLMNESISTSAGASHGQLMTPRTLKAAIEDAGREPFERTTLYERVDRGTDEEHPLDALNEDSDGVFGTYDQLVQESNYRFKWEPRRG